MRTPTQGFSRHRRGDFSPSACLRCSSPDDIIDLGAEEIPGYGRLYLCARCSSELAEAMGYVLSGPVQEDERRYIEQVTALQLEVDELSEVVDRVPTRILAVTQELNDGISDLVRTASSRLRSLGDRRADGVPVPAGAEQHGEGADLHVDTGRAGGHAGGGVGGASVAVVFDNAYSGQGYSDRSAGDGATAAVGEPASSGSDANEDAEFVRGLADGGDASPDDFPGNAGD